MKKSTTLLYNNNGLLAGRVLLNGRSSGPAEHANGLDCAMGRLGIATGDCLVAVHSERIFILRRKQMRRNDEKKNGDRPTSQFS